MLVLGYYVEMHDRGIRLMARSRNPSENERKFNEVISANPSSHFYARCSRRPRMMMFGQAAGL